jgi:hypothetical protein
MKLYNVRLEKPVAIGDYKMNVLKRHASSNVVVFEVAGFWFSTNKTETEIQNMVRELLDCRCLLTEEGEYECTSKP